jgi:hypothetical protein
LSSPWRWRRGCAGSECPGSLCRRWRTGTRPATRRASRPHRLLRREGSLCRCGPGRAHGGRLPGSGSCLERRCHIRRRTMAWRRGSPCQPESSAGLRLGEADERWLWREVWRIVREVGPAYLFVENVAAHLSGTFGRVVGDLAASGWRVEWDCVPASAVGAPHQRDRLFVLAERVPHSVRLEIRDEPGRGGSGRGGPSLAGDVGAVAWPPGPDDADGWDRYLARYPGLEPAVRRGSHGLANRLDRLHAIGNGVVSLAADRAFRTLWTRLSRKVD